jgi:hypothetical protein
MPLAGLRRHVRSRLPVADDERAIHSERPHYAPVDVVHDTDHKDCPDMDGITTLPVQQMSPRWFMNPQSLRRK